MTKKLNYINAFLISLMVFLSSCVSVSYSFSGASIDPECKTFSVNFFPNRAQLVNPNLSTDFTEKLKEKFRDETNLTEVVNQEGHLHFEGYIKSYVDTPQNISADNTSESNRLTIVIKVKYTNSINDKFEFDKDFSFYKDYTGGDLSQVEANLVEEIIGEIVNKIFQDAVANW